MKEIPTAMRFMHNDAYFFNKDLSRIDYKYCERLMVEFAQLHLQNYMDALKERVEIGAPIDRDSIQNSIYPLTNIK